MNTTCQLTKKSLPTMEDKQCMKSVTNQITGVNLKEKIIGTKKCVVNRKKSTNLFKQVP